MRRLRTPPPTLRLERGLLRSGARLVAGMDEVGRGALAGPVTVGVALVGVSSRAAPPGLRDSKLLSPPVREALVAPIRRWAVAAGVGHAEPGEIDAWGIMTGLRLAGRRALIAAGVRPDLVVLDGNHDWLTDPAATGLLADLGKVGSGPDMTWTPPVRTVVKGDETCSSVAAASVLAKTERDAMMRERHEAHPTYEWAINKGYATAAHREALLRRGPCEQHRRSWNLMGAAGGAGKQAPAGTNAALNHATERLPDASATARPDRAEWDMMGGPMRDATDEKG